MTKFKDKIKKKSAQNSEKAAESVILPAQRFRTNGEAKGLSKKDSSAAPQNDKSEISAKNSKNNSRKNAERSKEKSIARRTLHYFWQEIRQHKLMLTLLLILTLLAMIANNYVWPLFMSEMINRVAADVNISFAELWPLAAGAIGFMAAGNLVLWRVVLIVHWKLDLKIWRSLSEKCFGALAEQSMHFHNNRFSGSIVSQTNKFTSSFERLMDTWTWNLFPMIISIVVVCGVLAVVGLPWLALGNLILSIFFITYTLIGFRKIGVLNENLANTENKLSGQLADSMANVFAVKSFGREKLEIERYRKRNDAVVSSSTKLLWGTTRLQIGFAVIILVMFAAAIIFLAGGREWFHVEIGTLILAVTYTVTLGNDIWMFNNVMRQINRAIGDAHEMTKVLDEPVLVKDLPNAENLKISRGDVEFRGVSFHHDDASENDEVFHNFNLKIPAGERIGLVGHSGSGKTTLTKLLLRFADVQSGEILIDNQNIAQITQNSLRKNIAYVPQEPLLFHRTIAENISYGKPNATLAEIREAAWLANALDFIEKLPEKFETLTGERGVKLSGGQRQRIAIARAILKNAPILILDEATSALDTESEKLIQDALKNLMQNRTSIVIAHRLSTVANLDRIVVLEDGKIVEDGAHAELLKRGGKYAKLWNQQTGFAKE